MPESNDHKATAKTAAFNAYVEAAMVACPRCRAAVGSKCVVRACRNGYRNCDYAMCAYWKELPEPHLERAVRARQQSTPPGDR